MDNKKDDNEVENVTTKSSIDRMMIFSAPNKIEERCDSVSHATNLLPVDMLNGAYPKRNSRVCKVISVQSKVQQQQKGKVTQKR